MGVNDQEKNKNKKTKKQSLYVDITKDITSVGKTCLRIIHLAGLVENVL